MNQPSSVSQRIAETTLAPWRTTPNWYVTNGSRVVGPVSTSLLLRGIAGGRVSRECYVAQYSWSNWREQNRIREVRALRRWQYSQRSVPSIEPVKRAMRAPRFDAAALEESTSGGRLLSRALELAVQSTRASVGIVHQPRPPHVGLVTSWAHGPGMGLNLGEVVPWNDDARTVAQADQALLGEPERDVWARSSARRLSSSVNARVSGVALVPIRFGGTRGLLELGRYDHGFRNSDVAVLEDLSNSVVNHLARLRD